MYKKQYAPLITWHTISSRVLYILACSTLNSLSFFAELHKRVQTDQGGDASHTERSNISVKLDGAMNRLGHHEVIYVMEWA